MQGKYKNSDPVSLWQIICVLMYLYERLTIVLDTVL